MDNKNLGIILIIIALVLATIIYLVKLRDDKLVMNIIDETGSCYLDDGTCLHAQRGLALYIIGWVSSAAILTLGAYLIFFEKSQKAILSTLENHKKIQIGEEKFNILLKGLSKDEQLVIKAIKEQDGITQQTLRLRTDLHKSKLSILLDGLEKKELIARKEKGKTKQVFLKIGL
jgi:DNA-binding MarR family transcriptional regulator